MSEEPGGDVLVDITQESINRLKAIARLQEELDARDVALREARAEIEHLKDKWMTAAGISDANKVAAACFEERLREARARIAALEKVKKAATKAIPAVIASASTTGISVDAMNSLGNLQHVLTRLDAAPGDRADIEAAPVGDGWRPIETAPRDGTFVWVWAAPRDGLPGFVEYARYHQDAGWCVDELREATLWQPAALPPPAPGEGDRVGPEHNVLEDHDEEECR